MSLRLISFPTCPFVQRAVFALEEKGAPYTIEFIDLANKPAWFLAISPRGKVPVLVVEGTPLFESQAIVEYLDETVEPRLASADAVERARERAWFAFAAEDLFLPMYRLMYAKDPAVVDKDVATLRGPLARLETELAGHDWLSGDGSAFGLADVAMLPFLTRAELVRRWGGLDLLEGLSQVRAWADRLLARPAAARSVPADFEQVQRASLEKNGSAFLSRDSA
jgi:glutathione S-transferase